MHSTKERAANRQRKVHRSSSTRSNLSSPSSNSSSNVLSSPSSNSSSNVLNSPSSNSSSNVLNSPSSNSSSNVLNRPSSNSSSNVLSSPSSNSNNNVLNRPSSNSSRRVLNSPSSNSSRRVIVLSLPNSSNRSARSSRRNHTSSNVVGRDRAAAGRHTPHGSKVAPKTGPPTIAPGSSVAATAADICLRLASISISAASTSSGCARSRLCTWGIRAFSTRAFRSCWWIHGRNTGPTTGMTPTTFTSIMTMGTTFTTAVIRM